MAAPDDPDGASAATSAAPPWPSRPAGAVAPDDASIAALAAGTVALIGLPTTAGASFLPGTELAPGRVREELASPLGNLCCESGRDLAGEPRLVDLGDLAIDPRRHQRRRIEQAVAAIVARGARPLALGGDHSVSHPILRAVAAAHPGLRLVHVDAHADLYDELDGDRHSHACAFARVHEEGLVAHHLQIGIRTLNPPQRAQADRFGVEIVDLRSHSRALERLAAGPASTPVYLSLDLDALDPAFAPGVSHPEPGGLSTRQAIEIVQRLPGPLVGADLVELNPLRDPVGLTARVAAKLVKEIADRLLGDPA